MDETNPYESPKHVAMESKRAARGAWRTQDFVFALAQQSVLLGITVLLLDGLILFRFCLVAAIAHWVLIAIIFVRRSSSPTKMDVALLKFGFLFCLFAAWLVGFVVAAIRAPL